MSAQLDRVMTQSGEIPETGDAVLGDVQAFIKRFCAFPDEHCLIAVTLWAAHSHIVEYFHSTPRLALLSPEPASGKTRVLEVLNLLVPESMFAFNASSPAIFRTLEERQITLLFDEVDAIWRKRGKDENHEDLRSMLNAGYKSGATIPRCVGPNHEVKSFKVFCAVALAGLGEMPETIMSRSVIIKMRPRGPNEYIEPFRTRCHEAEGHVLRDRLANWSALIGEETGAAWPEIPEGIIDRNEEIWEPLLAVADSAGGEWHEKARDACVVLCKAAEDRRVSLGVRLLFDLRMVFERSGATRMFTKDIIEMLTGDDSGLDDDAPWAGLQGSGIDPRKLASLLKRYGIQSQKVKIDGAALRGYRREDLWDTWQRYLPPLESGEAEPVEPMEPFEGDTAEYNASTAPNTNRVPEVPEVPDFLGGEGQAEGAIEELLP